MKTILKALAVVFGLLVGGYAISHGGALDAAGCHTDTKTGVYHCHR